MLYTCSQIPFPLDSILDAVFTVSPNKQYLGIVIPTTPATTGPGIEKTELTLQNARLQDGVNLSDCLWSQPLTTTKSYKLLPLHYWLIFFNYCK